MSSHGRQFDKSAFIGFFRRAGTEAWESSIVEHLVFQDEWGGACLCAKGVKADFANGKGSVGVARDVIEYALNHPEKVTDLKGASLGLAFARVHVAESGVSHIVSKHQFVIFEEHTDLDGIPISPDRDFAKKPVVRIARSPDRVAKIANKEVIDPQVTASEAAKALEALEPSVA